MGHDQYQLPGSCQQMKGLFIIDAGIFDLIDQDDGAVTGQSDICL